MSRSTLFLDRNLEGRVANLESVTGTISALATENRKRLTNTDSSLGGICAALDRLLSTQDPKRECCYITHNDNVLPAITGNFMMCVTSAQALAFGFGSTGSKPGVCATTCGSLVVEKMMHFVP